MAQIAPASTLMHQGLFECVTCNTTALQAYLAIYTACAPGCTAFTDPPESYLALWVPSQWDHKGFAFLGNVTKSIITTLFLPATAFELTTEVEVHLAADSFGLVWANPHCSMLNITAGTGTMLPTRHFMALQVKHAPLLMDAAGIPLFDSFLPPFPTLVQHIQLMDCAPLIDWFRVTLMHQ